MGRSEYEGKLSDGGEELIVTSATDNLIHRFTYDDDLPWPSASDGIGYTLVLKNPDIPIPDHGVATNWAASAELGGSPGFSSDIGFIGDPLADIDQDGLKALLEYTLGSSDLEPNGHPIEVEFQDFLIASETHSYLTISYLRNQHSLNAVDLIPEVSNDLTSWNSVPHLILVSKLDNNDGTSRMTFRSNTPVGEAPEEREFIRVRASISP